MKFRVIPCSEECEYYIIQYKRKGFFNSWKTLTQSSLCGSISLSIRNQSFMWYDYNKAVEFAKKLTEEKVNNIIVSENKKFKSHIVKLQDTIDSRNKVWISSEKTTKHNNNDSAEYKQPHYQLN